MSNSSRIRKRPVSFGNPALGTYEGYVYTRQTDDDASTIENGASTLPESAQPVQRMVAMINVSPDQVPEGILSLSRSHRPAMEHVRITIAEPEEEEFFQHHQREASDLPSSSLKFSSSEEAERNEKRSYLILFDLLTEEDANIMVEDLNGRPYTSLDETDTCTLQHVVALEGKGGVSLLNPLFAPSTKKKTNGSLEEEDASETNTAIEKTSTNTSPTLPLVTEDLNCAVCLEHMSLNTSSSEEEKASILTTVCNHTFHLACIVKCQDSPCPVCRYDHSGLNETLSQCHLCGTTDRNYVCLICGVVSCVGGGGSRAACAAVATNQTDTQRSFLSSHASQHYDETLHAYALDTETQHVWDFAGQGYVHRLLQNKEDGKLVEVNDPNNTTSQERSLTPGLSDAQEGEVVHRKLEGFASQYYTLLKSQLEQQRTFYEGRLEEIRREFALKQKNAKIEKAEYIVALKHEKKQLSNRIVNAKRKSQKVTENVGFLTNMNESLQANKGPLEQRIKEVQHQQIESRDMLQKHLPALEEKVTTLMLQLTGGEDQS